MDKNVMKIVVISIITTIITTIIFNLLTTNKKCDLPEHTDNNSIFTSKMKVSNVGATDSTSVNPTLFLASDVGGNITTFEIPRGTIIAYYNKTSSVSPTGWAMCDGNNGTPDLRGRFIVASA